MDKFVTGGKVLVGDDFNGHVSCDMGGFGELHRGFNIGLINDGEIRLLDWTAGKALGWMNTCVQKRKNWLITFRLGETETMIDCIFLNNK